MRMPLLAMPFKISCCLTLNEWNIISVTIDEYLIISQGSSVTNNAAMNFPFMFHAALNILYWIMSLHLKLVKGILVSGRGEEKFGSKWGERRMCGKKEKTAKCKYSGDEFS